MENDKIFLPFNPSNWFWFKQNGAIYSSAIDAEIEKATPEYIAFINEGGVPSPYPKDIEGNESFFELMTILAPYNVGRYNQIKAELEKIDEDSIRSCRALLLGEGTDEDRAFLKKLKDRGDKLREELRGF